MSYTFSPIPSTGQLISLMSDSMSDSSWSPSEEMGIVKSRVAPQLARDSWMTSSSSGDGSASSSVDESDLDEFIMSTSQSAALSRQRKKGSRKDGLMTVASSERRRTKKKRKSTLATPLGRVSQEVRDLLGKGHNAFLKRDYDTAILLLEEAIRLAPGLADPFVTLGAIYEDLNDPKRSLEALLVAVHLTPSDAELWKRVAAMSQTVGNLDQAIYCLKRCVKAAGGDPAAEEPYLRDLANIYMQAGRFQDSANVLGKLFPIATGDDAADLGVQLAKSLYNINEKSEAAKILEKLMLTTVDANVINMLAEVYLDTREWGKCFQLLTSVLDLENLSDPEKCPVDLVAKLAVAAAPTYSRHAAICRQTVECVLATPVESHHDLYLQVADGLLANGLNELALALLEPALDSLAEFVTPDLAPVITNMQGRAGKCYYAVGKFGEAAALLEKVIAGDGRKPDPDSLVMLADAWRRTGKDAEAGELLLRSLNYEDLVACRTLPTATSTTQRRKWLDTLQHLLATHGDALAVGGPEVLPIQKKFASTFLQLLNDCELDSQRIVRHRIHVLGEAGAEPAADTAGGRGPVTPAWRVRKELDLDDVEDAIGTAAFVELIERGCAVCASIGQHRDAVLLIEAILYNRRKKWSQRTPPATPTPADTPSKFVGDVVEILERLSFRIALDGGLNKVSSKYLRQELVAALDELDQTTTSHEEIEARVDKGMSVMSRLMFGPGFDAPFTQREILDQRSWLVRQACRHPNVFAICMLCGHLCVASQNYRFAALEYTRAHRLRPSDPFALLCLGSSMIAQAMSRTTRDRQFMLLKAFAVLNEYKRVRPECPAETEFNLARAFHQLSLWTLADRSYRRSIELAGEKGEVEVKRVAAYNLSLIRQRSGLASQARSLLFSNIVAT